MREGVLPCYLHMLCKVITLGTLTAEDSLFAAPQILSARSNSGDWREWTFLREVHGTRGVLGFFKKIVKKILNKRCQKLRHLPGGPCARVFAWVLTRGFKGQ
jgi:hypothetical protein